MTGVTFRHAIPSKLRRDVLEFRNEEIRNYADDFANAIGRQLNRDNEV
jgi:hypothetical protein